MFIDFLFQIAAVELIFLFIWPLMVYPAALITTLFYNPRHPTPYFSFAFKLLGLLILGSVFANIAATFAPDSNAPFAYYLTAFFALFLTVGSSANETRKQIIDAGLSELIGNRIYHSTRWDGSAYLLSILAFVGLCIAPSDLNEHVINTVLIGVTVWALNLTFVGWILKFFASMYVAWLALMALITTGMIAFSIVRTGKEATKESPAA